ncbi:hypothetical protein ACFE04_030928 [Oxalis oulophora]
MEHCLTDLQIQQLATTTHGFVGADLAALCNEAGLVCLRRFVKLQKTSVPSNESPITCEGFSGNEVEGFDCLSGTNNISRDYLDSASSHVPNQADSSLALEVIDYSSKDIGRCSKTTLVEEECLLKVSYEDFEKAKMKIRPSAMREVILEVPKVNWNDVGGQGEVKNQLMEAGNESASCRTGRVDVTVIAATNRPDKIDSALLRPGRFDRLLYVGPPSEPDREEIFRIHLRKIPCCADVSIKELARLAKGCTGADISLICREAAVAAIEESLDASEITMQHLRAAIRQVQPSGILPYQELSAKFQRLVHSGAKEDSDQPRNPQISSHSNSTPMWTVVKSALQFIYHLPASILHAHAR